MLSGLSRNEVLAILRTRKEHLRQDFGVDAIGVFGSVARDEARPDSDVDIVVRMKPDGYAMVHIKEELEQALGRPVDIVRHHPRMGEFLKKQIEREALYV